MASDPLRSKLPASFSSMVPEMLVPAKLRPADGSVGTLGQCLRHRGGRRKFQRTWWTGVDCASILPTASTMTLLEPVPFWKSLPAEGD